MILADALGTIWFTALVALVGLAAGWFLKGKFGDRLKF